MANYHTADPYGPTVADRGTAEASHGWHVMAHHCLLLHLEVANLYIFGKLSLRAFQQCMGLLCLHEVVTNAVDW